MKRSLRTRLMLCWLAISALCAGLALLLGQSYLQGAGYQIEAGERAAAEACLGIQNAYRNQTQGPQETEPIRADLLYVLVELALRERNGVEGGIWTPDRGFVAYAYPTYEGTTIKRDVPEAEQPRIAQLAQAHINDIEPVTQVQRGQREASILAICALPGAIPSLAAWTLTRVPAALAGAYNHLAAGIGVLLLFVLGSGIWLATILHTWSTHLAHLEQALAHDSLDELPQLALTGEADLDRIVAALNQFNTRLRAAHLESAQLADKLAQAARLSALGRLTAGMAHEVRNPIAAMRLKAENALSQPTERQGSALQSILKQIERLDALVQNMLSMTHPLQLQRQDVEVGTWLKEHVHALTDTTEKNRIALKCDCQVTMWNFDPLALGRALDNLLWNAVQHTPADGRISVEANERDGRLLIRVHDTGPGVPEELRAHLFEPFARGRAGGTGLGLALSREVVLAHGGDLRLVESAIGACFQLELT